MTVFIVPTDGYAAANNADWTGYAQEMLAGRLENSAMVPIAVTTFREYEEAKSILTEKIWFRDR